MEEVIVGLDVGTSSMKAAILITGKSTVSYITKKYIQTEVSETGVVPAAVYVDAMKSLLGEIAAGFAIKAIAVATQMYSLCRMTDRGVYVYQWNCLWKSNEDTGKRIGNDLVWSGCRPDTLYPAYKLAALSFEDRKSFLPYGIKEYLIRELCGFPATDYSTASASGLFCLKTRDWNLKLIESLGYKRNDMPLILRHDQVIAHLLLEAFDHASDTTVIVPGLGDGPSASLACAGSSSFCGNLGTSMAARVLTDSPDLSAEKGLWNLPVDEKQYTVGGISSNACSVFHWAEDNRIIIPDRLKDTENVRFFPWLFGERTPYWSSDLQALFTGIQVVTDEKMLGSAVVKAIGFSFVRMAELVGEKVKADQPLILSGGGTNIRPLMEVIAGSISRKIILLKDETYLGATGALVSASRAAEYEFIPDIAVHKVIEPDKRFIDEYRKWTAASDKFAADMRENKECC